MSDRYSVGRWFNSLLGHFDLSLLSILPQSTRPENGYLALKRQCLKLVRYMLPAALESVCTVPAREHCEHFGGYTTINRIPLPFLLLLLFFLLLLLLLLRLRNRLDHTLKACVPLCAGLSLSRRLTSCPISTDTTEIPHCTEFDFGKRLSDGG